MARLRSVLSFGLPPSGAMLILAAAAVVGIGIIVAWALPQALAPVLVVALALNAYAAYRWPRATVVVAALSTFTEPVLLPAVLPAGVQLRPLGVSEPMLVVTALVIGVHAVRRGTFVPAFRDPILAFGALFVAVAVVSAVVNAVPVTVAVLGIFVTVDALAVYFVARMLPFERRSVTLAVSAIVGLVLIAALFGIAQIVLHPDLLGFASFAGRFGEGGRITSFLGNPNMVAAAIGLALPFPLYGTRHFAERRHRRMAFAVVVVLVLALLLTFSRGAWIAVVLGILIGTAIFDRRAMGVFLVALVLAYGTSIIIPRHVLIPAAEVPNYFPEEGGAASIIDTTVDRFGSVYERRDLRMRFIVEGVPIVSDHPWLGVGPGRYGGAAATIIPSPVYDEYDTGLYGFRTVHNFWLHMAGEVGALGTAVFVAMGVGLAIRFGRHARRSRHLDFALFAGASTAVIVVGLNSMTEMIFEGNLPAIPLWLVFGMVSVLAPAVAHRLLPDQASPGSGGG
jgi:putative inorganic carbon (HCO3(-)) transporter